MTLSDMIQGINGFLVALRSNNTFDELIYLKIKEYIIFHSNDWKSSRNIPIDDAIAIFDLIDQLSGGSVFWSDEVTSRAKDAVLELQEIIHSLE